MKLEELKERYNKKVKKTLLIENEREKAIDRLKEILNLQDELIKKQKMNKNKMNKVVRDEIEAFFTYGGFKFDIDEDENIIVQYKELKLEISEVKIEEECLIFSIRLTEEKDGVLFYYCERNLPKKSEIMNASKIEELNNCSDIDVLTEISIQYKELYDEKLDEYSNVGSQDCYYSMASNNKITYTTFKQLFETCIEFKI